MHWTHTSAKSLAGMVEAIEANRYAVIADFTARARASRDRLSST
jgi:hypothetical protein